MKKILVIMLTSLAVLVTFTPILGEEVNISEVKNDEPIIFGTNILRGNKTYNVDYPEELALYLYDYPEESIVDVINSVFDNTTGIATFSNPYDNPASTYFSSVKWIYRSSDGWNLSIVPKSLTRNRMQYAKAGWVALKREQYPSSHWYNTASLEGQYYCHFTFAGNKNDWNIAPSIPNRNQHVWDMVKNKCN